VPALPDSSVWRGRRVVVTGHTGFKGSWLALWLTELGAEVYGLSRVRPPGGSGVYELANVREALAGEHTADVRDASAIAGALSAIVPEVVFHLAGQAIVRRWSDNPATTWEVNVGGTVNVLQSIPDSVRAILVVTSDKCYRDVASDRRMREDDALGGSDTYSATKAAQELVAASFRHSILADRGIALATARAGNVLGGGDCAQDRVVPDAVRAARAGAPLVLRNPDAVRSWQHVLNALSGYLILAEELLDGRAAEAWNFGPDSSDERSVSWLVERLAHRWPGGIDVRIEPDAGGVKEKPVLRLDSSKAHERLGWAGRWDLETAIAATVDWYAGDPREATLSQIAAYSRERDQTPTGR
jgi:CDP-glucose 4,6-dehydratase